MNVRELRAALDGVDDDVEVRVVIHAVEGSVSVETTGASGGFTTVFNVLAGPEVERVVSARGRPHPGTRTGLAQSPQGATTPPAEITSRVTRMTAKPPWPCPLSGCAAGVGENCTSSACRPLPAMHISRWIDRPEEYR